MGNGTIVAALLCFTPVAAIGLGAAGLSGWVAGVDAIAIPALIGFSLLTAVPLLKWLRAR